jgi:hypothetical protein
LLLEVVKILWFTSQEMIVITHSQQSRTLFPSSVCALAQSRGRAARQ